MAANFEVQVAHSVEEVGQAAWDQIGNGQPFTSYRWYRFAETVLTEDWPVYIILAQQGKPVARATFWLKRHEYLPISSKAVHFLIKTVIRFWPILVCRSPMSGETGLVLPDSPLRRDALETLAQTASRIGREHRTSFVFFDYVGPQEKDEPGWPGEYSVYQFSSPGTVLNLRWPDFEGYVQHLSKSARKDYHRHCNRAADLGITVEVGPQVTEIDRALELIRNVERHHGSPPNPDARKVMETAHLADASWLAARLDGRLVGCGLLLGDRDNKALALLGLDYEVKYVYFQLVYAAIRHAIESGCRVLRGGGGAYEIKERLGFETEHQEYLVYTAGNSLLRRVTSRIPMA